MKNSIYYSIFGLLIATIGWVYLVMFNWKVAIAVFLIIWSNNIVNNKK